jgi:hypothetical protein
MDEIDENHFQPRNDNETYGLKHRQQRLPCQDDSELGDYNL